MTKLRKKIIFESAFATYTAFEVIGEGGSGQVFAATDTDGTYVAIKELRTNTITGDKRKRFKNEIGFLSKNVHENIVKVIDNGYRIGEDGKSLFYVMPRYESNLAALMSSRIQPALALPSFSQILDGVEAAHLHGVIHRDLKPANVLCDLKGDHFAVADFGIARFLTDQLTIVETKPQSRLANFQYAAPEQRLPATDVGIAADIYALGLILNEMITGQVPHGTGYRTISEIAPNLAYLDQVVEPMIRQNPAHRPASIKEVKVLIQKHEFEAVSRQKLSEISTAVVPENEVDDILAHRAPQIVEAKWENGTLKMRLDLPVNQRWVSTLQNRLGSYQSIYGVGPEHYHFTNDNVSVNVRHEDAQRAIDFFKQWLPQATNVYRRLLEQEAQELERAERERLRKARDLEEQQLRVNSNLRF